MKTNTLFHFGIPNERETCLSSKTNSSHTILSDIRNQENYKGSSTTAILRRILFVAVNIMNGIVSTM